MPIKDRVGFWEIDGQIFNEDSAFSEGRRLRGRPKDLALAYIFGRDVKDRIICEIRGEEISFDAATIHHRKSPGYHVAKYLGIACFTHNSAHQSPSKYQPPTSDEIERESKAQHGSHTHPNSFTPTSAETARSIEMFPKTVEHLFHPVKGKLAKLGMDIEKDLLVNTLPEVVGLGRATTFGKYIHEFVKQGYLTEQPKGADVYLVRTGKKADALLKRVLGLSLEEYAEETLSKIEQLEGVHR